MDDPAEYLLIIHCLFILFSEMHFHIFCLFSNWTILLLSLDVSLHSLHISFGYVICSYLGDSAGKESACNAGDPGSVPRSGRSPRERIG